MKTIYNEIGEEKTCEAVDAREHIETGRWFFEKPLTGLAAELEAETESDAKGKKERNK